MSAATSNVPAATEDESIAALRQLRALEIEWAARGAKAKADGEAELARLHEEADAAVEAARVEAERQAENRLKDALRRAEAEAANILRDAERDASAVDAGDGGSTTPLGPKLLDLVLGPFVTMSGKRGA